MKHIIPTLLTLAATAVLAAAREVSFAWDANPAADHVTEYRLFRQDGGNWAEIARVAGTEARAVLPEEACVVAVRAVNALGMISPLSDPLAVPLAPTAPQGLRVKITIELESSQNLKDWKSIATISVPQEAAPAQFFRTGTR